LEERLAAFPADRVEDYGYVGNRAFYADLLRACDVLVQPSRAEGVSKVLVEAMAAGLPIVATDAGATPEVLGHGERGVLVPVGEPAALGGAIVALLADTARMDELRERGLAWAEAHTAETQAGRLVGWLRSNFPTLPWS
jgi:glycosyltransferase involved in cell wall biosynthesis